MLIGSSACSSSSPAPRPSTSTGSRSTTPATPPARSSHSPGTSRNLFGLGFLGAALLAACIVPLSAVYSVAEAFRRPGGINAVLLLLILPFMRRLAQDPAVMGDHALGLAGKLTTGITLGLIAASVTALAILSVA